MDKFSVATDRRPWNGSRQSFTRCRLVLLKLEMEGLRNLGYLTGEGILLFGGLF